MTGSYNPAAGFAPGSLPEARRTDAIGGWFTALTEGDPASRRYLLLLRFAVLNLVALALLGAAWIKGWLSIVTAGDTTGLVLVIGAVFLFGLVGCARKIWQTSVELNHVKQPDLAGGTRIARYLASVRHRDGHSRALAASALKLKLAARIAPIRHLANSLVFLGLIGTVVGFIIALSGVNAEAAADVDSIGPMVSTLIGGMSVALYTILVGAILNIWLMTNYRLLESGTVTLTVLLCHDGSGDPDASAASTRRAQRSNFERGGNSCGNPKSPLTKLAEIVTIVAGVTATWESFLSAGRRSHSF